MYALHRLARLCGRDKPHLDVNTSYDEYPIIGLDFSDDVCREPTVACINLARLQRASKRPGQSATGGRHDVIERRRVLGLSAAGDA